MYDVSHGMSHEEYLPLEGITRRRMLQSLTSLGFVAGMPRWAFTVRSEDAAAFFTEDERAFITTLADTLIPRTDTPGAKEAGVPARFEALMTGWASGRRRAATKQAIAKLQGDLEPRAGQPFVSASPTDRLEALEALDTEAYTERRRYGDYRDIKVLLVRLYYASEPGATLELRYDPIPGSYDGDVPFSDVGRTWAPV